MPLASKAQIKYAHVLLGKEINLKDKEAKESVVFGYSKDPERVSTKKLTFQEMNQLIKDFGGKPHKYEHWAIFDSQNKQHRLIMSLLQQIGWTTTLPSGRLGADMLRFSEFLKSDKSPVNKRLKDMEPKELTTMINCLQGILKKYYK